MQDTFQIQQFLRFRRQNPNWLDQVKKQRIQQKSQQKQITKLISRNNAKRRQLQTIKKQYQKVKKNSEQVLFQMKNQQDALDNKIAIIQKKKMQEFRKTVVVEEKVEHLKEEIERLKKQFKIKESSSEETIKNLQNQIGKYKQLVSDVKERISTNQEWLNNLQANRGSIQSINITQVQAEVQQIKKSNEALGKEVIQDQKRLRRQADQIRKAYKDFCEKSQDRIKSWLKKCELVIEQKKDIRILIQSIDDSIPIQDQPQIEALYKNDLITLASLYDSQSQKQLGEFFTPFSLKTQGTGIQKSAEKYFAQDVEQQLNRLTGQLNNYKQQLTHCDLDIQSFKQRIEKYNKDIDGIKQSINYKKKQL